MRTGKPIPNQLRFLMQSRKSNCVPSIRLATPVRSYLLTCLRAAMTTKPQGEMDKTVGPALVMVDKPQVMEVANPVRVATPGKTREPETVRTNQGNLMKQKPCQVRVTNLVMGHCPQRVWP